MLRSTSQTAQTTFNFAPTGLLGMVRVFVSAMAKLEPAATATLSENSAIRSTGRTWLM